MTKGESIVLRISGETKAAIKAAADNRGQSLTTFITDAAMKQVCQATKREAVHGVHGGVPSFFRACCSEAQNGGENGYSNAGWHFSNAIGSQAPYDLELDEWQAEVNKLKSLPADDDGGGCLGMVQAPLPEGNEAGPDPSPRPICDRCAAGLRRWSRRNLDRAAARRGLGQDARSPGRAGYSGLSRSLMREFAHLGG